MWFRFGVFFLCLLVVFEVVLGFVVFVLLLGLCVFWVEV